MCECVCVCARAHVLCVSTCARARACMCVRGCVRVRACARVFVRVRVSRRACQGREGGQVLVLHVDRLPHTRARARTHTHTQTHTHTHWIWNPAFDTSIHPSRNVRRALLITLYQYSRSGIQSAAEEQLWIELINNSIVTHYQCSWRNGADPPPPNPPKFPLGAPPAGRAGSKAVLLAPGRARPRETGPKMRDRTGTFRAPLARPPGPDRGPFSGCAR